MNVKRAIEFTGCYKMSRTSKVDVDRFCLEHIEKRLLKLVQQSHSHPKNTDHNHLEALPLQIFQAERLVKTFTMNLFERKNLRTVTLVAVHNMFLKCCPRITVTVPMLHNAGTA